ncbi:MAG TPA: polyprenyl synthetase family protein [Candidatus Krumholzibacteria bacterium]|nr:polyprenyl synthetase family protein [Candidatus Krumholzibacteria bacterium]
MTKTDAEYEQLAERDRVLVERRLTELVDTLASQHAGMRAAIEYSLLGAGKRLRPLLCLWTHDALGGAARDAALDCACALEALHTYSLVHDDLPCMDDDDLRRGKPSSHRKFGEAVAVLTGDALQALAFQIVAGVGARHGLSDASAIALVGILADAAGTGGLISGQALDLSPPAARDIAAVDRIHTHKTAVLIAASMEAGAVVADAAPPLRERVRRAGLDAGRAFQIADDLLDLMGTRDSLGKTPGKDVNEGKLTYPAVAGIEEARLAAGRRTAAARAALPEGAGTPLDRLLCLLAERDA